MEVELTVHAVEQYCTRVQREWSYDYAKEQLELAVNHGRLLKEPTRTGEKYLLLEDLNAVLIVKRDGDANIGVTCLKSDEFVPPKEEQLVLEELAKYEETPEILYDKLNALYAQVEEAFRLRQFDRKVSLEIEPGMHLQWRPRGGKFCLLVSARESTPIRETTSSVRIKCVELIPLLEEKLRNDRKQHLQELKHAVAELEVYVNGL